jgi:hypothetical protein
VVGVIKWLNHRAVQFSCEIDDERIEVCSVSSGASRFASVIPAYIMIDYNLL